MIDHWLTGWSFAVRRQVVLALRDAGWAPCACGLWHARDDVYRLAPRWTE